MSNKYEEAKKIHAPIVETMQNMGYGLLKDGDTFYQHGMELEPRTGITFTMRQAYAIHKGIKTETKALNDGLKSEDLVVRVDELWQREALESIFGDEPISVLRWEEEKEIDLEVVLRRKQS